MNRYLFTLKNVFSKRSVLQAYLKEPGYYCHSVRKITPMLLQQKGIKVLVLDIDGVLCSHDAKLFPREIIAWLEQLQQDWPHPVFIFSNRPSEARQDFFAQNFPSIYFIKNVARKPYPEGLLQVQQQTGVKPDQILMVDDRLLTGVLAAVLAGTQALWLRTPLKDFKANPLRETWFQLLRWIDRLLLQ